MATDTDKRGAGSGGSGAPPTVLLAALAAALLIAVALVAFAIGSSDGDSPLVPASGGSDDPAPAATTPATEERALLTLQIEGGGAGKVRIEPLDVTCIETCEHEFKAGTRVSVTADPEDGSRFEGWSDACTGTTACAVFMDRERAITATFEGTATTQCEDEKDNDDDGFLDDKDPGCKNDNTEAPDNTPTDCNDGRDNDSDGLIDVDQDPGCDGDGTEADTDSGADEPGADELGADGDPVAPPPPPPPPPPATTVPGVSQCSDGIDNDGDDRTDRPADPGCDADGTEEGG